MLNRLTVAEREQWTPVRSFSQLEPGCHIRSAKHPSVTGTYRGNGHGLAIIRIDLLGADRLCKPTELEVLLEK